MVILSISIYDIKYQHSNYKEYMNITDQVNFDWRVIHTFRRRELRPKDGPDSWASLPRRSMPGRDYPEVEVMQVKGRG